jgi:hypothetical protein
LALHPDKTRLIKFGRFAVENRRKRGERKPETFTFLGFTHICGSKFKGSGSLVKREMATKTESSDDVEQNTDTATTTPKPRVRTMIATREPAPRFGDILVRAAWARGFAATRRKAFVADGASANWTI